MIPVVSHFEQMFGVLCWIFRIFYIAMSNHITPTVAPLVNSYKNSQGWKQTDQSSENLEKSGSLMRFVTSKSFAPVTTQEVLNF